MSNKNIKNGSGSGQYEDRTKVSGSMTKKDLNKMALRSYFVLGAFNYERLMAGGWLFVMLPGLRKIHTNQNDFKKSMKMHMEFFNSHPFLVTLQIGIVLAMEEAKEEMDMIRNIKVATMGPLGGIGDALIGFTMVPILASIGASLALTGNVAGPLIFIVLFNVIILFLRVYLMHMSYSLGMKAIDKLQDQARHISRGASILSMMVVGGLIASYVHLTTPLVITAGAKSIPLQADLFDKLVPNLLPLLFFVLMYFLIRRGKSPIFLIMVAIAVGIAGSYTGIL